MHVQKWWKNDVEEDLVVTEMVPEAKIFVEKHSAHVLFHFHLSNTTITMSSLSEHCDHCHPLWSMLSLWNCRNHHKTIPSPQRAACWGGVEPVWEESSVCGFLSSVRSVRCEVYVRFFVVHLHIICCMHHQDRTFYFGQPVWRPWECSDWEDEKT